MVALTAAGWSDRLDSHHPRDVEANCPCPVRGKMFIAPKALTKPALLFKTKAAFYKHLAPDGARLIMAGWWSSVIDFWLAGARSRVDSTALYPSSLRPRIQIASHRHAHRDAGDAQAERLE